MTTQMEGGRHNRIQLFRSALQLELQAFTSSHLSLYRSAGGVCPVCRLPLVKTVSDAQPGVVAFHCGKIKTKTV